MKNFKKLSREELKNVFGGQSCSLVIQGSNGQWITRSGTCKTVTKISYMVGPGDSQIPIVSSHSYCETGLGETNLSSNGGVSRCN